MNMIAKFYTKTELNSYKFRILKKKYVLSTTIHSTSFFVQNIIDSQLLKFHLSDSTVSIVREKIKIKNLEQHLFLKTVA